MVWRPAPPWDFVRSFDRKKTMAEIKNIMMQTANLLGFRSIWKKKQNRRFVEILRFPLRFTHESPRNPSKSRLWRLQPGPRVERNKNICRAQKSSMRNAPLPGGNPQMSNAKRTLHSFWPPDFRSIDGHPTTCQIPVA